MKQTAALQPAVEPSSFRDPSGFVVVEKNRVLRVVDQRYQAEYDAFVSSGLKNHLITERLLLPFDELKSRPPFATQAYKVLASERLPFWSYPYEWSFRQLQVAALATLRLQREALAHNMTLKDASAFNIQFVAGKPVLIDLLSFERYRDGEPWVAYRQFCQHFLAPLLLMAQVDGRMSSLLRVHLDGIPLDLASRLLPKQSWMQFATLSHIHFHARNQQKYADLGANANHQPKRSLPKQFLLGILDSLESLVQKQQLTPQKTEWDNYYQDTNYSDRAFAKKKTIVQKYLTQVSPKSVWDLGGNTGEFSRLASDAGVATVCFDIDPRAVDQNYRVVEQNQEEHLLPLVMDFTNQSPALGWALTERKSLIDRGPAEMLLALALIHHLSIGQNIPFEKVAAYFAQLSTYLVIEFVPKQDSKVQILLATREDIFSQYTQSHFEASFGAYFSIVDQQFVGQGSKRVLYLMKRK